MNQKGFYLINLPHHLFCPQSGLAAQKQVVGLTKTYCPGWLGWLGAASGCAGCVPSGATGAEGSATGAGAGSATGAAVVSLPFILLQPKESEPIAAKATNVTSKIRLFMIPPFIFIKN
ncbi:MAG: hypothetical protein A2W61_08200 [Deltaproteobacteria bacterium RIFCSPLOWO2_01_44_7]|nr:MAG: hypothetical protein A2712_09575 [Deltaproteobacteria bacterium RIFCSPHIGHO2_01_FULL_43_49]OGQ14933.1 MAG: hypothetical protein A3D22_00110 [Deltaproteobacteria bacterium RIFCSPHIGHO2_02_FULL_44_53]OGQ29563.1 MAG: hypothetical protein A3D98_10305 [Deltaproteobacteria bacterium RIFCSPHIGHO2_12_FULL_44_21]OGQ31045.1 MAG: hypothetical protein A2979_06400 [Deltaproteobacteria bacterium RIFCSPLOWO2_01_FULL_45_74]OGQ40036.1 MAG: hypothetical protein A2W61_08200 [Deltaproteobacteria bacterium 